MKNEITINTDQLATMLACSMRMSTEKGHDQFCTNIRWAIMCVCDTDNEFNEFYDAACEKARQLLKESK